MNCEWCKGDGYLTVTGSSLTYECTDCFGTGEQPVDCEGCGQKMVEYCRNEDCSEYDEHFRN